MIELGATLIEHRFDFLHIHGWARSVAERRGEIVVYSIGQPVEHRHRIIHNLGGAFLGTVQKPLHDFELGVEACASGEVAVAGTSRKLVRINGSVGDTVAG